MGGLLHQMVPGRNTLPRSANIPSIFFDGFIITTVLKGLEDRIDEAALGPTPSQHTMRRECIDDRRRRIDRSRAARSTDINNELPHRVCYYQSC